jgi:polygalacturonase
MSRCTCRLVEKILCVLLPVTFLTLTSKAVTPWTLLVNTNNVITITNAPYNAVGDGVTTNTTAIQNAINAATAGGNVGGLIGGMVEIPPGTYLCGPLTMKKNVMLQLDAGAILRLLPYNSYPGAPTSVSPFINGSSLTNIAVTGLGMIDGQGSPWWPGYKTNSRPVILNFSSCSKVLFQDFTITNPPTAHIAIKGANAGNINIIGIKLYAPASENPVNPSHNTDGVDFAETNALFQDCVISTGDDNIAVGSSASVSRDILVTNCFFGEGHGCSIGSYTSGGVSNLTVINCTFSNTDSGIRIKSQRDRGGVVQNLNYYNLTMSNVMTAASILSYYEFGQGTLETLTPQYVANFAYTSANPVPYEPPIYRNITFSNITATVANAGQLPLFIIGLPDVLVSDVVFKSVNFVSSSTKNAQIYNTTNLQFINCSWKLPAGDKIQFWNADVTFSNSSSPTNLLLLDGLTTNGVGNTLEFDNALATISNTNAIAGGAITLNGSTLIVSNNLTLFPSTPLNFILGTNAATVVVKGNLTLGGTNNISVGDGFTNGTYTLMAYTGNLNGNLPTLGATPPNFVCVLDANHLGQVNLIVTPPPPGIPTNLTALGTNLLINLQWFASSNATSYNLKRSMTNGGIYSIVANATATNYSDASVAPGTTYYYVVAATNATGESADSIQVSAIPLPSSVSTNLNFQIYGDQLQLTWPQDHLGWRLQIQTNDLSSGLGTNWVDWPDSTNVFQTNIIINPATGSVFLRLVYP